MCQFLSFSTASSLPSSDQALWLDKRHFVSADTEYISTGTFNIVYHSHLTAVLITLSHQILCCVEAQVVRPRACGRIAPVMIFSMTARPLVWCFLILYLCSIFIRSCFLAFSVRSLCLQLSPRSRCTPWRLPPYLTHWVGFLGVKVDLSTSLWPSTWLVSSSYT